MYIVYSHVQRVDIYLTSLERPEEGGEPLGADYVNTVVACCIATQVTHLHVNSTHSWKLILCGQRYSACPRCPLVRRPDKGGFTVVTGSRVFVTELCKLLFQ